MLGLPPLIKLNSGIHDLTKMIKEFDEEFTIVERDHEDSIAIDRVVMNNSQKDLLVRSIFKSNTITSTDHSYSSRQPIHRQRSLAIERSLCNSDL